MRAIPAKFLPSSSLSPISDIHCATRHTTRDHIASALPAVQWVRIRAHPWRHRDGVRSVFTILNQCLHAGTILPWFSTAGNKQRDSSLIRTPLCCSFHCSYDPFATLTPASVGILQALSRKIYICLIISLSTTPRLTSVNGSVPMSVVNPITPSTPSRRSVEPSPFPVYGIRS